MPIIFTASIMKVGNSLVFALPKPVCEGFGIEKGDTIKLMTTDKGIYIPLSPKKDKATKESEAWIKENEAETEARKHI